MLVAISSYFINAGVYVADKFLLSKKIHSSVVYAFFVGIWSIGNFIILPFGFWVPDFRELSLDLLAGLLFLFTLIFWYKALHQSEATRVVPIVGALVPIFSWMLAYIFLGETLDERQMAAFLILVAGGILISVKHTRFYFIREVFDRFKNVFGNILGGVHAGYRPTRRLIFNSIISALFFAAYYVLIKYVYMNQPFIGAFVWSRLGTFIGVIFILLVPYWRQQIVAHQESAKKPNNLIFFFSVRLLAAVAFILLNWAICYGNVAMINSLQGTQYLFLILIVFFLSTRYPNLLNEELGKDVMVQKLMGIMLVSLGLYFLVS